MSVARPLPHSTAPQWWRSGVRTRTWWIVLVVMVAILVADAFANVRQHYTTAQIALYAFAQTAEVVVALLFLMWRPGNLVGPLLIAYVIMIDLFIDPPVLFPHSAFAWTVLKLLNFAFFGVYAWMLFSFPSGRIWNRAAVWLVVAVAIFYLAFGWPAAFFSSTPRTLVYVGHGWSGLDAYAKAWASLSIVVMGVLVAFLVARVLSAAPGSRRRLIPLYALVAPLIWAWTFDYGHFVFTGNGGPK
jgi:hypothetical protein